MSRLKPDEGWFSLILLIFMLLTIAWSIEAANWAEGLALLQGVVLVAVVVGFAFSKLPIPDLVAHMISTVAGAGWAMFVTGRLLDPASITHRTLVTEEALTWQVRFTELIFRIQTFIEIARTEGVGQDNLVFILQLAFLIWLVSYASVWFLLRVGSVWGAIIPTSFAMILNLYYAPPDLYTWMAVYLLCALLLVIRSNIFHQQNHWRQAGVSYSPDISFDFLRDGTVFALVVILLAWFTPTTNAAPGLSALIDRFGSPVYRFQREFNRLYSSLNYRSQPGPAYFGDTMTLSGAVSLGDAPIFDAVTDRGRYWRGVVYDQYTGRGWVNTATSITGLADEDERLNAFGFELRETVTQTIRVLQPGVIQLHALPQPINVLGLPTRVQYDDVPATGPNGVSPLDVSMIQSRRPLDAGESYTVLSSVTMADVQSLREAGTDYPDWVREKYLQLPDEFPQRVKDLAVKITADKTTPYDKVTAIESFLRQITYDEQIPAPPTGVDSVDWFLFDQQAGYCDYYASALVTMSRSLGIPARMAAGYSRGEFDAELGVYRQREYDAHSWPEVFFPRYGWIEFEPTAADPRIIRPATASTDETADPFANETDFLPRDELLSEEDLMNMTDGLGDNFLLPQQRGLHWWMWGILSLLGALGITLIVGAVLWQRTFRHMSLASGMYARMVRVAHWLGIPPLPSQTPNEYAGQLASAVPEGGPAIGQITAAYVLERFADVAPTGEQASTVRDAWLNLRRILTERIALHFLQRFTGQSRQDG